jgi:4-amino-4-deoxy-L-arabinose transferase-like glycosyltransferase
LMFNNIYMSRPQGGFDAWSIWNRAARFIYRDPENWQATLSPEIYWGSHPDYPLLIPMNVAWGWDVLDAEVQRVPMMQGLLFSIASVGVLFSSLAFSRTNGQGVLASLILMSTPAFIGVGAAQVSDIPVTFFILTSSVILYVYFSRGDEKALILCGILAGLAGWAKNEGVLFIVVCPIAIMLTARKSSLRPLLWYLAGLSIPLLVLLYFKSIASPGDLFSNDSNKLLSQITDPSRYLLIAEFFLMETIRFGGVFFPVFIILFVYAIFVRSGRSPVPRAAINSVLTIVFLQLIGYGAVYVLTPHDLEWHLFTSLSRLILHIYPISLFLLFSVLASPEEIF